MMTTIGVITCFLVLMSHFRVEGTTTSKLHEDEQLGATFSITTENGEIYDCVAFSKQPAFNNPLLKNLTFEARNSKLLSQALTREAPLGIGLKGGGCPSGFVPILKIKDRQNYVHSHSNMTITSSEDDLVETDHCYATVQLNNPDSKYVGAGGAVSIYNPKVVGSKWSASRMRLSNGPDGIEVGWMVNPGLYKDTKTHLYIRFVTGGKWCFNLECSGFVQVAKDLPIGAVPDKISQRGSQQYYWTLSIDKHKDDGNWWVSIGEGKHQIGYWPKSLFKNLADFATQVEWGGEVYNPPNSGPNWPPQMGCGFKPKFDTRFAASYIRAVVVDESYQNKDPQPTATEYETCKTMYTVIDAGHQGDYWGHIILFGGPGVPFSK